MNDSEESFVVSCEDGMLADFFPWVFSSFFSIDAFLEFFVCASKDVMHDPDFF